MSFNNVNVRVKIWLDQADCMLVGPGRMELLQKLDELGSLNKAAASLKMSYRAAWGMLKKVEETLGEDVLHRKRGRGGCSLTPFGKHLLKIYSKWQREVEEYALERAQKHFDWEIKGVRSPGKHSSKVTFSSLEKE
ncbi:MAG: winged helix-turn-helix domain-containing protein [Desulfovibrio sp.]